MNTSRDEALAVREIGSFHAGGRIVTVAGQPKRHVQVARNGPNRVVDLNGDYVTAQCYVHYVRLAAPRTAHPVMFWHGGAMTGVTWETTPDGRPGWQMFFLRRGFDVYVCDALERGRAGWSPYPEIYTEEPIFRTQNEAWTLFRFGLAEGYRTDPPARKGFEGQLFPEACFDTLGAQFVPRWTVNTDDTLAAYAAAFERTGPVYLIAHSQGANLALEAAQRWPEQILGLIVVEPAAAPRYSAEDLRQAAKVPLLCVWGDFIDRSPLWQKYRDVVDSYVTALSEAGGTADVLDLPARGIAGNSHVPMMDGNSDTVARLVAEWIEDRVDPAGRPAP